MKTTIKICTICRSDYDTASQHVCVDADQAKLIGTPLQPHTGMIIDKRYELREKLGEGGMGSVFRARRLLIEDFVAMKFVRPEVLENPDVRQRFYQEAQVAARIKHPNVVTVHDFGETHEGMVYLVMEFLEGMSLGQHLKKNGAMQLPHVLTIGSQICEALTCMLENNVIHRDLKPDNIMLVKDAQGVEMVKVVDFGVAKIVESNSRLTRYKARIGSPVYCSPEQFLGKPVDHRTDLYGLGVILFECLTGQVPFEALTEAELLAAIVHKMPQRLDEKIKGFSALAADLVHWLLAKDPNDRPFDASQVGKCLQTLLIGKKTPTSPALSRQQEKPNVVLHTSADAQSSFDKETDRVLQASETQRKRPAGPASDTSRSRPSTSSSKTTRRSTKRRSSWPGYAIVILCGLAIMAGLAIERGLDVTQYRASLVGLFDQVVSFSKELVSTSQAQPATGRIGAAIKPSAAAGSIVPTALSQKDNVRNDVQLGNGAASVPSLVRNQELNEDPARQLSSKQLSVETGKIEMIASREIVGMRPAKSNDVPVSKNASDDREEAPSSKGRSKKGSTSMAGSIIPKSMVWVRETAFILGDILGDGNTNEKPAHMVRVGDFLISKHEVTNKEYFTFVKETGKHTPEWIEAGGQYHYQTGTDDFYKKLGPGLYGLDNPVVGVSWQDAVAYCEWLSKKNSLRYRLPTEAEWELAAQGGKDKIKYSWGNGSPQLTMGGNVADEALKEVFPDWPTIWRAYNDQYVYTSPAGKFSANALGLHDMTGNVWEWCSDWYDENYYQKKVMESPIGPPRGAERVIRGGSWSDTPTKLRISHRRGMPPSFRSNNLGFRVVASLPASLKP